MVDGEGEEGVAAGDALKFVLSHAVKSAIVFSPPLLPPTLSRNLSGKIESRPPHTMASIFIVRHNNRH